MSQVGWQLRGNFFLRNHCNICVTVVCSTTGVVYMYDTHTHAASVCDNSTCSSSSSSSSSQRCRSADAASAVGSGRRRALAKKLCKLLPGHGSSSSSRSSRSSNTPLRSPCAQQHVLCVYAHAMQYFWEYYTSSAIYFYSAKSYIENVQHGKNSPASGRARGAIYLLHRIFSKFTPCVQCMTAAVLWYSCLLP